MSRKEDRRNKVDEQWLDALFELFGVCDEAELGRLAQKEKGFGRYIYAARANADISLDELTAETSIPFDKLVDIEIGEFPIELIRDEWVDALANALGEDVNDLNLILGRYEPVGKEKESTVIAEGKQDETADKVAGTFSYLVNHKECDFLAVVQAFQENDMPPELVRKFVFRVCAERDKQDSTRGWIEKIVARAQKRADPRKFIPG